MDQFKPLDPDDELVAWQEAQAVGERVDHYHACPPDAPPCPECQERQEEEDYWLENLWAG